jgi:hypothetical protein
MMTLIAGPHEETLAQRQRRKFDYHEARAVTNGPGTSEPVARDVTRNRLRRPWNCYWSAFGGRLRPAHSRLVARLDYLLLNLVAPIGRLLAGRFVLMGTIKE